MRAISSRADIVIGGAAAGVGKTFSMLLDPLKHITRVPGFRAVIFRRTSPQIFMSGGLWDASEELYSQIGIAHQRKGAKSWEFEYKAGKFNRLTFAHLQHEKDKLNYQGAEIAMIGFDELTHFSEKMFFYLLTRNRSTCGVRPYMRATCNPDPESWVFPLISWWIGEDGLPMLGRQGKMRYFARNGEEYYWGDTFEECYESAKGFISEGVEKSNGLMTPENYIKSLEFVAGSIWDNKKLLSANPDYVANLQSQDEQTRRQLLEGNWKIVVRDDELYKYGDFLAMFSPSRRNLGEYYLTADIALHGSDKFIIYIWQGFDIIDACVVAKSDGNEVIQLISQKAAEYGIPHRNIAYDADGVGAFIGGFLKGSEPFNGNGAVRDTLDPISKKLIRENYANLKAQVFYRSAAGVSSGKYRIIDEVGTVMYDNKQTLRQRMFFERRAIRREKPDGDQKLRVIPKEKMKAMLGGTSPDLMDAFAMREIFELKKRPVWVAK
jgi:hypothetical protein